MLQVTNIIPLEICMFSNTFAKLRSNIYDEGDVYRARINRLANADYKNLNNTFASSGISITSPYLNVLKKQISDEQASALRDLNSYIDESVGKIHAQQTQATHRFWWMVASSAIELLVL